MSEFIVIAEEAADLRVRAVLLDEHAPHTAGMIRTWLSEPRCTKAVQAMWTGPEISCQLALEDLSDAARAATIPPENATINPLAGELVFLRLPPNTLDSGADEVFDLGLFYDDRARLLFPFGLMPGNIFARVVPEDLPALKDGCRRIRSNGRTSLNWSLVR